MGPKLVQRDHGLPDHGVPRPALPRRFVEELLSPACKALRTALHPLVEAHLREELRERTVISHVPVTLGFRRVGVTWGYATNHGSEPS